MPILKMKDGVRIRVKEGADYDAIANKYFKDKSARFQTEHADDIAAQQAADREEYDPTKGMSGLEKFGLGASAGVRRVGRGIGDMIGVLDPEDVAARNDLDKYVKNTGAGAAGDFLGNTAAVGLATAPLGAGLGATVKALGATGRVASSLGGGLGNVAAQGALGGAINADPGERAGGAGIGALLGGGTYGVLKGAGRLLSGLGRRSANFENLRGQLGDPDFHAPLSHTVDDSNATGRMIKATYNILSGTPGPGAMLAKQQREATNVLAKTLGERSTPSMMNGQALSYADDAARLASTGAVDQEIANQVGQFSSMKFTVGNSTWNREVNQVISGLDADVQRAVKSVIYGTVRPFAANTAKGAPVEITGDAMLDIMKGLRELRNPWGGSMKQRGAQVQKVIDAIQRAGDKNPKFNFTNKRQFWHNVNNLFGGDELKVFKNFQRSLGPDGSTTPSELAKNITEGPLGQLANLGSKTLGDTAGNVGGGFQASVQLGPAAALAAGWTAGGPAGVAATLAASMGMSTKAFQRALVGDVAFQRKVAEILRQNPKLLAQLGAAGTAALIPEGQ